MHCKKCGKEIDDGVTFCKYCGCDIDNSNSKTVYNTGSTQSSKKTTGILLGLFLGIIGLIIGICLYPNESEERKTFISGWVRGFVIGIIISVVIGFGCGVIIGLMLSYV